MYTRYKRLIWFGGIIGISICAFLPQIIDWLYPKQGLWFTVTTFTKEQLLTFYGSFLGFIGTILLGALALWQNINIHNMAIKQEALKNRAFFALVTVTDFKKYALTKTEDKRDGKDLYTFTGDILNLDDLVWMTRGQNSSIYCFGLVPEEILHSIVLKNVGGNFAHRVRMFFIIDDKEIGWNKFSAFAVGEEIVFYPLCTDSSKFENKTMQLVIEFKDLYNNDYKQSFEIVYNQNLLLINNNSCPKAKTEAKMQRCKNRSNNEQ